MLSEYEPEQRPSSLAGVTLGQRETGSRSSTKNRGRLDTVAEIVNACSGGANKSRVMLVANVNSVVATELLGKLVASGLVSSAKEDTSVTYGSTREGLDFVNKYTELVSMLCPGTVPQTRLAEIVKSESWI